MPAWRGLDEVYRVLVDEGAVSRYRTAHVIAPDRLENLRRVAAGVTRLPGGAPWALSRTQMAWFARDGYLELGAHQAPSDAPRRHVTREVTLTDKARAAIAQTDADRAVDPLLAGTIAAIRAMP